MKNKNEDFKYKPKICFISSIFPPVTMGGVERYLLNLLENNVYISRPLIITKYYPNFSVKEESKYFKLLRVGYNISNYVKIRGINYILNVFENKLYYIFGYIQSKNIVCKYDLINSQYGTLWDLKLGNILAKKLKKPHILTFHGRFGFLAEDQKPTKKLLKEFKKADEIIVNRMQNLTFLKALGFKNVHFLRNSIPVEQYTRPKMDFDKFNKKEIEIIFVGRLTYRRGANLAVRAFLEAFKSCKNINLRVVGDGPMMKSLKYLVKKYGLENKVTFYGKVFNIKKYFRSTEIFLATSPIANSPSLSLREAMASGLATIATDVEETDSIIQNEETGLLVRSEINDIKDAIVRLVNDRQLILRLSFAAEKFANENFDLRNYRKKYLNIISEMVQKCRIF